MSNEAIDQIPVRVEIKNGFMKKLKTMKRKFFVLVREADESIWLDYWDSVKKYEASNQIRSKKAISITDSFYINQRPACADKNKQHVINVFTSENCFSLVLENEAQLSEWMDELRKQRSKSMSLLKKTEANDENQDYAQVWQVQIAKKGLGLPPNGITGLYRVCLATKTILLFKVDPAAADKIRPLEFPLNSIRKCARAGEFFSMELGRGSTIGAGELLLETDDPATARHMHEKIRDTMHTSSESSSSSHRPRSSTGDGTRTRRATLGHINASTGSMQSPHLLLAQSTAAATLTNTAFSNASAATSGHTSASTSNTSIYTSDAVTSGPFASASSFRDRCDSEPAQSNPRSRCVSEGNSQLHYTTVSVGQHRPSSGHRINSSSPPSASLNHSTESVGSFSQSEDYTETDGTCFNHSIQSYGKPGSLPLYPHREVHGSSIIPSQPSILEQDGEDSAEAYMIMDAPKPPQPKNSVLRNGYADEQSCYVLMSPSSNASNTSYTFRSSSEMDTYVDMSPAKPPANVVENGYLTMTLGSSRSTSSNPDVDEGYLNMAPLAPSLPAASSSASTSGTSGGRPNGTGDVHHHHRPRHHRSYQEAPEPPRESLEKLAQEFPLAPVKSFFSPAEEPSDLIKPVRAYSIGSRPKQHHVLMKDQDLSQTNWYGGRGDGAAANAPAATRDSKGAPGDASRVRAYSMGSRSGVAAGSHFRMNQPLRKRALTQDSVISSSSSTNMIPETVNEATSPASSS